MTCPTADMESCDKKCKCVGGPCAGTAYDCADPCGDLEVFDEASCECVLDPPPGYYSVGYEGNWDNAYARSATTIHYLDTTDGGKITFGGRQAFACGVPETIPNGASIEWFEGEAKAGYLSEGTGSCFISGLCSGSTDTWPFYTILFQERTNGASWVYTPYLNGIPCSRSPSNTKRISIVTIIYGETLAACQTAKDTYLAG